MGPILSLHSKKLSISPISAFRPRRWKGKIVNDKTKIVITNLNPSKRPISAVADNSEVRMLNQSQSKLTTKLNLIFFMIKTEVYKKRLKLSK
jgi:NAD+ kinase